MSCGGRRITGFNLTDQYPDLAVQPEAEAAGATWVNAAVVMDGNLITSSRLPKQYFRRSMEEPAPNKFVTPVMNGRPVYQYADPLVCKCVYFGAQQNWDAYRQELFAQRIADENQMTAIMNQEALGGPPGARPTPEPRPRVLGVTSSQPRLFEVAPRYKLAEVSIPPRSPAAAFPRGRG